MLRDFCDSLASNVGPRRKLLDLLVKLHAWRLVDALLSVVSRHNLLAAWGIGQGMRISGSNRPVPRPDRRPDKGSVPDRAPWYAAQASPK